MHILWGVIFGRVTRDYGGGFKVTTFIGESAVRRLWPTGIIPAAVNDNEAKAA